MYRQANKQMSNCRQRGVALLAVMMAVVVAFILSTAFLSKQSTAVAVGENKKDHTAARHIAESTIEWALEYVNNTEEWRDLHSEGEWLTDENMFGGTVTLYVYDGEDEDGDGVIDSDGDLSDDASEKFTLIAIARHNGLRHEARSVVQPEVAESLGTLLLLVGEDLMSDDDAEREALFVSWGWNVITLVDDAATADYNVALALADVVYFSEECVSAEVGSRLSYANTIGIVNEKNDFNDDLKITTSQWGSATDEDIEVLSASHYITQTFLVGDLQISSGTPLSYASGSVAGGAVKLANREGSSTGSLYAMETGSELTDGSLAAGRRVALPFGPNAFDFSTLTDNGKELVKRSLYWASRGRTHEHLVAHWKLDQTLGQVAVDSSGYSNHATLTNVGNGADWVFGQANNAIDFDGEGLAYARAPDSDSLDLEHEGTIAAWIKPEAITDFMGIVHKGELINWTDEAYSLQFWTGRKLALTFHTTTGSSARCYGNQVLSTDTWYHVVGTWNSAGMRIYVDGALDASNTEAHVASTSDGSVQIGSQLTSWFNSSYKNLPFNGLIDDVRIYNRSLTESEIESIYESVVGPEEAPTLVAEYTFQQPDPLNPKLVGHWALDEDVSGARPGGVYVEEDITMNTQSVIDAYDSSQGPQGPANQSQTAVVYTNSVDSSGVWLNSAYIHGDVLIGQGGDPPVVVKGKDGWVVTGSVTPQTSNIVIPAITPPAWQVASDVVFDGGNHVIDSDLFCEDFRLVNGAVVTIQGDIRIEASGKMSLNNSSIVVPESASLSLHVNDIALLDDGAFLNDDSEGVDRVTLYQYDIDDRVWIQQGSRFAGRIFSSDRVEITTGATVYGSVVSGGELIVGDTSMLHVDHGTHSGLAGGSSVQVVTQDETGVQNGQGDSVVQASDPVIAGAYGFDGSSSYVLVDHNAVQTPDAGVISFWFQAGALSGRQALVSKDSSGFDDGGQFTIYIEGTQLRAILESSVTSYTLASGGLVAGQWHHAALSFGPKGMMLYLDGALADSGIYNGGLDTSSGGMGNTEPLVFGAGTDSSGNGTHEPMSDYFAGKIDDVRIYDDQLSVTQLAAVIADASIVPEDSPLVLDTSGYGGAMDLLIDDLNNVSWVAGGGLDILSPAVIGAADAAVLYDALTATDEMTLEVIYTPADVMGDAVVAGMLSSTSALNFAVTQDDDIWGMVRTSATGSGGTPAVGQEDGLVEDVSTHVILSYDGENVRMYRDGNIVSTEERTGGLSWSLSYAFNLGSQPNGSLPLIGRLERVAVYDKGVNLLQAQNIFLSKPPGLPDGDETVIFSRTWQER